MLIVNSLKKLIGFFNDKRVSYVLKVQKVLLDLDMQPIRDNQAKKLSGGQKRRLSVGIAVLGNPKVSVMEAFPTWCPWYT